MLRGIRVVIVDDEPDQAEMNVIAFGVVGAVAHAAESIAEAKVALERERFDVIVSDVAMPNESGYDLVGWLRATPGQNQSILAIALTGMGRAQDRADAFAAGFDEHCIKPFLLEDLFQASLISAVAGRTMLSQSADSPSLNTPWLESKAKAVS